MDISELLIALSTGEVPRATLPLCALIGCVQLEFLNRVEEEIYQAAHQGPLRLRPSDHPSDVLLSHLPTLQVPRAQFAQA